MVTNRSSCGLSTSCGEQPGGSYVAGLADRGTVEQRPHGELAHAGPGRQLAHGLDPAGSVGWSCGGPARTARRGCSRPARRRGRPAGSPARARRRAPRTPARCRPRRRPGASPRAAMPPSRGRRAGRPGRRTASAARPRPVTARQLDLSPQGLRPRRERRASGPVRPARRLVQMVAAASRSPRSRCMPPDHRRGEGRPSEVAGGPERRPACPSGASAPGIAPGRSHRTEVGGRLGGDRAAPSANSSAWASHTRPGHIGRAGSRRSRARRGLRHGGAVTLGEGDVVRALPGSAIPSSSRPPERVDQRLGQDQPRATWSPGRSRGRRPGPRSAASPPRSRSRRPTPRRDPPRDGLDRGEVAAGDGAGGRLAQRRAHARPGRTPARARGARCRRRAGAPRRRRPPAGTAGSAARGGSLQRGHRHQPTA